MQATPHVFFTVTNDLAFDQRMQRICGSLSSAGYRVTLVGRTMAGSPALPPMPFEQVRLECKHQKGKLFYIEYNYKLYRYLLRQSMDAICAIDLDTIVPVFLASKRKKIPRVYDAHEYFTELTEIKRRRLIHKVWSMVEKYCVPKFIHGYTVSASITSAFLQKYKVAYETVRNMPVFTKPDETQPSSPELTAILEKIQVETDKKLPIVLYQGAVNEGRGLIPLINAMRFANASLVIAGTGNTIDETKAHAQSVAHGHKIVFLGNIAPNLLRQLTPHVKLGVNLVENTGLNQYYSLANKYFDYIMAHKPQVSMNYPEYKAINDVFDIALLVNEVNEDQIAGALNNLLDNDVIYNRLKHNCKRAAGVLCWENEEKKLLVYWQKIIPLA